jgi:hypothetical protein
MRTCLKGAGGRSRRRRRKRNRYVEEAHTQLGSVSMMAAVCGHPMGVVVDRVR